jgi:hypothetical protein
MSRFISELFDKSPLLALPILSLVIFVTVFALVTIRVVKKGKRGFDDVSKLPLDPEDHRG